MYASYLHSIYREANSYPGLLPEGIPGNPENESPEALREKAWPLVQPRFNRALEQAAESYRALAGTGRTSRELAEVLPAARGGRVAVLFVADGQQVWGRFQNERDAVEIHRAAEPRDEDLLNLAAIEVLRRAGTVHALPPEEMPEAAPVAAIYRY